MVLFKLKRCAARLETFDQTEDVDYMKTLKGSHKTPLIMEDMGASKDKKFPSRGSGDIVVWVHQES